LTRSFICRIEHGKVRPSRQTLEEFARRLGRPLEYFTAASAGDRLQAGFHRLYAEGREAVSTGQMDAALELGRRALDAALTLGDPEAELRARLLLIEIHGARGECGPALTAGEPLEAHRADSPAVAALLARGCIQLGDCCMRSDQLLTARRLYRRSLSLTAGRSPDLHVEAQLRLACCCAQLGDTGEAAEAYRTVGAMPGPAEWAGLADLGRGGLLCLDGDLDGALQTTLASRHRLEALGHTAAVYARHNQAVIEGRTGHWDRAIELLQGCLEEYERRGETVLQASALEELAECLLAHRYLHEALEICGQALSLLGSEAHSFLRGRLYRQAATIHLAGGDSQRAYDLGLVSLELFRHLGARLEIDTTRAFLERLL
ncbi:MAG TPA: helix-turn-helix transcriptional regulator, partial [Symbiobacteriaceae bacterium]|nr:helix-turn-helix transcriptional regulator [Symbiobacteriaceae bacterium]